MSDRQIVSMRWFLFFLFSVSMGVSHAIERPLVTVKLQSGEQVRITRTQFNTLPIHEINSAESGRDGVFKGPLLRDFLAMAGVKSSRIEILAYDNYFVQIERTYWHDYDTIMATERNGATMKIRDKGPLWLVFPWDKHPELRNERFYNLSIWQIKEIKELP